MKNVLNGLGGIAKKLLGLLHRNWGYKLLALIFAIILWASVMATNNPIRSKTIEDLPIRIEGLETLQGRQMTLLETEDHYTAGEYKVQIWANLNELGRINANTVSLSVDLSKVVATGTQRLPIEINTPTGIDVSETSVIPGYIEVVVDEYVERLVPVQVVREGALAEGYWEGELKMDTTVIRIQGPAQMVDQVAKAQVTLPMDGIVSDYTASRPIVLVDQDGAEVDSSAMDLSEDSVILTLPVQPTKEVDILYDESIIGDDVLPEGFEITGIEVYPDKVTITASADILSSIDGIPMSVVDITGATADVTGEVALSVPEGVQLLDDNTVEVAVRIHEMETTLTFDKVKITVRGLGEGLETEPIETTATVMVTGPVNSMKDLLASAVKLYVDVTGLTQGTYELKVFSEIDDRYRVFRVDISVDTLQIVITG